MILQFITFHTQQNLEVKQPQRKKLCLKSDWQGNVYRNVNMEDWRKTWIVSVKISFICTEILTRSFPTMKHSFTAQERSVASCFVTLCFFPITTELLQLKRIALLAYDQHLFFKDSLCQSIEITALLLIWSTLRCTRRVRTRAHLSVRKQTARPPCLLYINLHYFTYVRGAAIQTQFPHVQQEWKRLLQFHQMYSFLFSIHNWPY
jgi:hypothetical protein